jgi:beta-lactamase superfamily II metal-dependent hydrolase
MRCLFFAAAFYACLFLFTSTALAKRVKPLQIYFVEVEGGQATLIVSPSGQSILVDTGWGGFNGRDAGHIANAAKAGHVKQIDYAVITHYHHDHLGGVAQLAERMKIGMFVDHGPNTEDSDAAREDYAAYQKVIAKARHVVVNPGDGLLLKSITVRVLTAAGERIRDPLPGAGEANPYCWSEAETLADVSENASSLGLLITYGKFRFLNLGDLTKKKELELVCPNNLVGTVDLYLTTHDGLDPDNPKAMVWALRPRVAIMNNSAHKGGNSVAWQIMHDSPGLEDLWQLHYAADAGKAHNVAEAFIANVDEKWDRYYIKVSAQADGTFTVVNARNNYEKTYKK